jgi:CheY-like chemotaxis protein/HPt (histidine-containing phosphotransfer) domain-containing protein
MKKIAVVEDNPDNRLLVQVILEPLYEVVEYETGFAALEGLPKDRPDLVLLDVSLPEMDGTEVLRRIRADENLRRLPVIALTAHAMAGDREKFLAAGFDDYVTKPIVDETVLLDAIARRLPNSAKTETGPVNPDAIERLCKLGGAAFAIKMIDLFISYCGEKVVAARQAQTTNDWPRVAEAVHPIKSSAGNVGAARVQDLATRLEQSAKQANASQAVAELAELELAFAEAKAALETQKAKLPLPPQ